MATASAAGEVVCQEQGELNEAQTDEVYMIVAGKPGNGKSTALRNIFGVDFEAGLAPSSITKEVTTCKVNKEGIQLTVVDTPGLGALDINKEAVISEISDIIKDKSYTLLYCLSVAPNCRLTEIDEIIIGNLHQTLGDRVWDRCVILFTFSDTARCDEFRDQKERYKSYIKEVAAELTSIIQTHGSASSTIRTVFECESNNVFDRKEQNNEIMAIPVGKNVDRIREVDMLPDVISQNESWADLVFVELMRKTEEEERRKFVTLNYGIEVSDSDATAAVVGLGDGIVAPLKVLMKGGARVGVVTEPGFDIHLVVTAVRYNKAHLETHLTPDKQPLL